jgi:hypothetical protein
MAQSSIDLSHSAICVGQAGCVEVRGASREALKQVEL